MAKKTSTAMTVAQPAKGQVITNYSLRAGAGCGKSTTIEWAETKPPKGIKPSEQQEAIFEALRDKKTKKRSVRVACFNKSIMEELAPRFPNADVRNNNKIGYHTFLKYMNIKPKWGKYVNQYKYNNIAQQLIGDPRRDTKLYPVISSAVKLADLARCTMTGSRLANTVQNGETAEHNNMWEVSQDQLQEMAKFYNMDIDDKTAYNYVEEMINIGIKSCREIIDFNDQIFLCNVFGAKPDRVSRCYIDEMQDLNAAQHELFHDTADQFVVVGDVFQSIYGFAGADPDSMPRFEEYANATLLPLTVTRRCPKSHVREAKRFLPGDFDFRAAPEAPDGSIITKAFDVDFYRMLEGTDNLCLSRTNAPMVQACFMCWKNNIPAIIRGRDVARNLAAVINRMNADTNPKLITKLMDEYQPKIENYRAADKIDLAAAKEDELELLIMFATETKTIKECVSTIYDMFDDDESRGRAIQFSTVHKAKGLEAENVAILTPDLLPHPGISRLGQFWARQEKNIAYVCYTRGKDMMYINDRGND